MKREPIGFDLKALQICFKYTHRIFKTLFRLISSQSKMTSFHSPHLKIQIRLLLLDIKRLPLHKESHTSHFHIRLGWDSKVLMMSHTP